ncbi:MAG TPA: EAL domain-containing protein, partial [Terriglobales bacterium]|nr:EAL domain-containing protein [Terriglobales bacterium]
MHKILWRQLKRLRIEENLPPDLDDWEKFLLSVDHTYRQADQDRYLLERSLAISSRETQDLYNEEKRRVEEALLTSEGKYRTLFEQAGDSIFIIDAQSRKILEVNQIAADKLGYTREELLAMKVDEINPPEQFARNEEIAKKLQELGAVRFESIHLRKNGSGIPVEVNSILLEQEGRVVYQSIARDITERKATELELQRLANYDSLTGISNRFMFMDRLNHAIEIGKRNKDVLAVLFLDLDGFKAINDAFGHEHGDTLLQIISKRIVESVRTSDTVARLGGDEFAILLEGLTSDRSVLPIVQKIINRVAEPFSFRNAEAFITSSIGISLFPGDGEDADTLIKNADQAMYLSKVEKNGFRFFTPAMKTQALERLELGNKFRHAIEQNEMLLVYQAQIDARSGRVIGVEALARWQHPQFGLLLPERFIPLAEEMGLIVPLSDWVLETACRQMQKWLGQGVQPIRLAVNLSERDINQADFSEKVEQTLDQTGLPAHLLELELSENTIFRNLDKAQHALAKLKSLGVRLAIDDFGTGYFTLSQLADFPFDA